MLPSLPPLALGRTLRRVTLLAFCGLAISAPGASAGVLTPSANSDACDSQVFERPFLPWLDPANYVLAPDGGLESRAAGWTLNGASVREGNEPFQVRDAADHRSLSLPAGSSATTPAMCVGIEHPTLRFFTRAEGAPLARLGVEVLFTGPLGRKVALPIGRVLANKRWAPTLPFAVVANLLPLLPGNHTLVAFRFTAGGGANWQIDDVYVDPYFKR